MIRLRPLGGPWQVVLAIIHEPRNSASSFSPQIIMSKAAVKGAAQLEARAGLEKYLRATEPPDPVWDYKNGKGKKHRREVGPAWISLCC